MKNKPCPTVYISNLSYERDRNGLRSLFSRYGIIKSIKIIVEPSTNQSRGMAFVEMSSMEEATRAIEGLDQQRIDGRILKANYATPLKESSRSGQLTAKKEEKDLEYVTKQLAKKARNDSKRRVRPF
jgi:RNA recognition motif-containing protein